MNNWGGSCNKEAVEFFSNLSKPTAIKNQVSF